MGVTFYEITVSDGHCDVYNDRHYGNHSENAMPFFHRLLGAIHALLSLWSEFIFTQFVETLW